jgi:hypothetical protein
LKRGAWDAAEADLQQALRIHPESSDGHLGLAWIAQRRGHFQAAADEYGLALRVQPGRKDWVLERALCLDRAGRPAEAIPLLEYLVKGSPEPALVVRLAMVLNHQHRPVEALEWCRKVLGEHPDHIEAHIQCAEAHRDLGDSEAADACIQEAYRRDPTSSLARIHRAFLLLSAGNFREGWEAYQARRLFEPAPLVSAWRSLGPEWDGRVRPGQPLTVVLEQGFGDVLQFLRYLPGLIERGVKVTVWGPPFYDPLRPLIRAQDWRGLVCASADTRMEPAPWVLLMDLPRHLDPDLEQLPTGKYLTSGGPANPPTSLPAAGDLPRLGVLLAGQSTHPLDYRRGAMVHELGGLFRLPAAWVHLAREGPLADPPASRWFEAGPLLRDFRDTAAMLDSLDAVISVDTAVIHLAGALGKTGVLLLSNPAEWRWGRMGTDSRWYPSLTLVRQVHPLSWEGVGEWAAQVLRSRVVFDSTLGE